MRAGQENSLRPRPGQLPSSPMEALADVFLCLMLGPYLLFFGFQGYENLTEWKFLGYLLFGGLPLAAALPLWGGLSLAGKAVEKKPWRAVELLALGYLCFSALSTLLSVDRQTALWGSDRREGLVTLALYCGGFLLLSRYGKARMRHLWIFAAAVSLDCALVICQFAGYNPFTLYPQGMTYYDGNRLYFGEFLGTLGNADVHAAVLCAAIPVFWAALLRLRGRRRFWLLFPLALSLGVLFKSFVAGAVLGVLGGGLLSLPVLSKRSKCRGVLSIGVLGLFLAAFPAVYLWGRRLGGFFYEASELLRGRWDDSFGSGRLYIWRSIWPLVPERLLFGGGPDTLGLRTDACFSRWDEETETMLYSVVDSAHNEYLGVLINQGLLAFGCFLALLVLLAVFWIQEARRNSVAAICGTGALCYCIQAFFCVSSPISTAYLWLALGLLASAGRRLPEDSDLTKKEKEETSHRPNPDAIGPFKSGPAVFSGGH